jgi:hypothetical protein
MVGFTGNVEVGLQVAANASRDFKRILLGLGGKGAAMIFEDADLTTAVDGIATTWSNPRRADVRCTHASFDPSQSVRRGSRSTCEGCLPGHGEPSYAEPGTHSVDLSRSA